jgi:uncharacterized phage protein (TIGR01671 family)
MREILFRGKRVDNGEWVEGSYFTDQIAKGSNPCVDISIIRNDLHEDFEVNPKTIGEFTGLHDKNGKKVFEGDFDKDFQVVKWCNNRKGWSMSIYDFPTKEYICCHCYNCEGNYDISEVQDEMEIIGNIHDKEAANG